MSVKLYTIIPPRNRIYSNVCYSMSVNDGMLINIPRKCMRDVSSATPGNLPRLPGPRLVQSGTLAGVVYKPEIQKSQWSSLLPTALRSPPCTGRKLGRLFRWSLSASYFQEHKNLNVTFTLLVPQPSPRWGQSNEFSHKLHINKDTVFEAVFAEWLWHHVRGTYIK